MTRKIAWLVALVLSAPHTANSYDDNEDRHIPGNAFVQIEPLEGEEAKIDNTQELREANVSVGNGLQTLKRDIITEGLRRAAGADDVDFEDAVRQVEICATGCAEELKACALRLDPLDTVGGVFCEIDEGLCEVSCIQDLLIEVVQIPGNEDHMSRLEVERENARVAALLQDFRRTQTSLRAGLADFEAVPLEELVRTNLEQYEEYGVPPGETTVDTALENAVNCTAQTLFQEEDCVNNSARMAADEPVEICKPDGECVLVDQVGVRSLVGFYVRSIACLTVAVVKELGCGLELAERAAQP